ncbi:MAG: ERF family protein [Candidatus Methanospirareceae archaeon]
MNVYEKIAKVRIDVVNTKFTKSGHNKFAGFDYFELGDFLPTITKLCDKYGILPCVTFTPDIAEMVIINLEDPNEKVIFTSPLSSANLKACHPIQSLGAVETYQRRYLYLTAFEIVEHEVLDRTIKPTQKTVAAKKPATKKPPQEPMATTEQMVEIEALANSFDGKEMEYLLNASGKELTAKKAGEIIYRANAKLTGREEA